MRRCPEIRGLPSCLARRVSVCVFPPPSILLLDCRRQLALGRGRFGCRVPFQFQQLCRILPPSSSFCAICAPNTLKATCINRRAPSPPHILLHSPPRGLCITADPTGNARFPTSLIQEPGSRRVEVSGILGRGWAELIEAQRHVPALLRVCWRRERAQECLACRHVIALPSGHRRHGARARWKRAERTGRRGEGRHIAPREHQLQQRAAAPIHTVAQLSTPKRKSTVRPGLRADAAPECQESAAPMAQACAPQIWQCSSTPPPT